MDGSPRPLESVARLYLMVFPAGHLILIPLGGAMATGADLALGILLLAGLLAEGGARLGGVPWASPAPPRGPTVGVALLIGFAAWAALSGSWGFHPRYALFKGAGYATLAGGAWMLARSGAGWRSLVEAWLVGCAAALLVLLIGAVAGPEALRARVLYGAGAIQGLPLPRVSGPFLHPSMLGGYLAVSGALLWGVWPELGSRARAAAATFGLLGLAALLLSFSTGWLAAGTVAILLGRSGARHSDPGSRVLRFGGAALAAVAVAGAVAPLSLDLGPLELSTGAVRPGIWRSALDAVLASPVVGVGAAPFLARAPDPLAADGLYLWDAHQGYLSVLGQFGLVGAGLLGAGLAAVVRGVLAAPPGRPRAAVLAALAGVGAHALLVANEDFRHLWALVGIALVVASDLPGRGGRGEGDAPPSVPG